MVNSIRFKITKTGTLKFSRKKSILVFKKALNERGIICSLSYARTMLFSLLSQHREVCCDEMYCLGKVIRGNEYSQVLSEQEAICFYTEQPLMPFC